MVVFQKLQLVVEIFKDAASYTVLTMRLPCRIFLLGWWIIGHWWMPGTQSYPKPSISVRPSNVVTLGGNVIICCQSEGYQHMQFYLQKAASSYVDTVSIKVAERDEVVFPFFNVTQSDAGIYWCTYCFKVSCEQQWSDSSDRAYINISDPSLPKPTIKMRPKGESAPGMNVTIECQGPEHVLIFSLHKSKDLIASQVVAAANVTATFPFPAVRLEDVGSYTCQYRLRGSPFIWSRPSDPVELILRAAPSVENNSHLGLFGLLLCALVLVVAAAIYRWRKGQH